ncbi:MAG: Sulfur carrier protein ThiS adenylyltransferase [Candidatus Izimaplasma bacterium HR2]|nr:MAG: Sulfur carrier protein ThiS adenylyltransferase [Candidatus Izimaplasma bacterium HR2]
MSFYDRQELIEGINTNIKVCCVGCGGIGYHVAKLLAMSGIEDLFVFDPDTLEESNLNRIDITIDYIGRNKADIVKEIVRSIRPEIRCKAFPFPLKDHTYPKGVDWVIDCTDNHASQIENQRMADENGAKYCKIGYDSERISISDRVAQWDTGDTQDGYSVTPSWVVPAIVVAALGVGKILKYNKKEIGCQIQDLYV